MIARILHPLPATLCADPEVFLRALEGPTRIEIPGQDASRCRVLVTLLHGNELSGLRALLTLLRERTQPAVTIYAYIVAREAALLPPLFSHRQLPGKRDYNRCFKPPFDQDEQGLVCLEMLNDIAALQPEFVIDMHNTSGDGPAFAVAVRLGDRHAGVVSLFTQRLVLSDLTLGSLMETDNAEMPVVTVECGGASEASADLFALESLARFFALERLPSVPATGTTLDIYRHPLRLELPRTAHIVYSDVPHPEADITLRHDIDTHNFGTVSPDTMLGWLGQNPVWLPRAFDSAGVNHFTRLYRIERGQLFPRVAQKLFMVTTNPVIAASDCLWYTVVS